MVRVTIEQKRGPVARRVSITAPSIARTLELAGAGRNGTRAKVLFPINPEAYFTGQAAEIAGVSATESAVPAREATAA